MYNFISSKQTYIHFLKDIWYVERGKFCKKTFYFEKQNCPFKMRESSSLDLYINELGGYLGKL